jgi:hypothetical protein
MPARHNDASATHLPETYFGPNKFLCRSHICESSRKLPFNKEIMLKILKREG